MKCYIAHQKKRGTINPDDPKRYTWALGKSVGTKREPAGRYITVIGTGKQAMAYAAEYGWTINTRYELTEADLNNRYAQERGWIVVL